ncbi:MAG: hypothetical protein MUC51_16870, partial [Anaerolineae bacterium]|nr:hypothetical protein [Anaerolineae bacterium]
CRTATVTALVSSHQWPGNEPNIIIVPNEHFENIVTPRHLGDAFYSRIPQKRLMPAGDRAVYAERLRAHLAPRRAALVAGDADGFSTD